MKPQKSKRLTFAKAPIVQKVKRGGRTVVSQALVKHGVSNLIPKMHIKRGDLVMLMSGSKQAGVKTTGKVTRCLPACGKVIVEGLNFKTHFQKPRGLQQNETGEVKKIEGAIFASKLMLFCTACKKPARAKLEINTKGKKIRRCKRCNEAFDS